MKKVLCVLALLALIAAPFFAAEIHGTVKTEAAVMEATHDDITDGFTTKSLADTYSHAKSLFTFGVVGNEGKWGAGFLYYWNAVAGSPASKLKVMAPADPENPTSPTYEPTPTGNYVDVPATSGSVLLPTFFYGWTKLGNWGRVLLGNILDRDGADRLLDYFGDDLNLGVYGGIPIYEDHIGYLLADEWTADRMTETNLFAPSGAITGVQGQVDFYFTDLLSIRVSMNDAQANVLDMGGRIVLKPVKDVAVTAFYDLTDKSLSTDNSAVNRVGLYANVDIIENLKLLGGVGLVIYTDQTGGINRGVLAAGVDLRANYKLNKFGFYTHNNFSFGSLSNVDGTAEHKLNFFNCYNRFAVDYPVTETVKIGCELANYYASACASWEGSYSGFYDFFHANPDVSYSIGKGVSVHGGIKIGAKMAKNSYDDPAQKNALLVAIPVGLEVSF